MKLLAVVLVLCASACSGAGVEDEDREATWRVEELEREVERLRAEVGRLEGERDEVKQRLDLFVRFTDPPLCPQPPKIDGLVLEVTPERIVVLDVGAEHGVQTDFTFSVYKGSAYHGQVRVFEVGERTSRARVIHEKAPIAAGDSASTVL